LVTKLSWNTPTMAELFYKQGYVAQAVAVYRRVVKQRPDDTEYQHRLQELELALQQGKGEHMGFREHMERIVTKTPDALACTIMGFDGIAIDTVEKPQHGLDVDVTTLVIEFSAATQQLRQHAAENQAVGGMRELQVNTENLIAVMRPLTDEFFLAVILKPQGLVGKARYLMRVAAPQLIKELS